MSRYCEICKANSWERTNHTSELENVKESRYSCDCMTSFCEEHYIEHVNDNKGFCPVFWKPLN